MSRVSICRLFSVEMYAKVKELGPIGRARTVVLLGSANGVETQKDNNSDISSIAQLEKNPVIFTHDHTRFD